MAELILSDRWGRAIDRDRPESSGRFKRRRGADTPKLGDQYGAWAGRDQIFAELPGGAMLQFDLSRLTLADFRSMRDHYQINASLTVLAFILHQIDWHIECPDAEIATMIEENMRDVWTQLIRALSQAFWAGYSPSVINFENDPKKGYIVIDKFKDLVPEECKVNWKKVEGYAPPNHIPPTFLQYDGILHQPFGTTPSYVGGTTNQGVGVPIPPENSLWYPLLMENGDYYGRKLLRPAFPAWYFSQLIHLFANRYYERFGEPTPIGRANFEDEVDTGDGYITGKAAMENILTSLRSRSVVVLPSDRDPVTKELDYSIEYLESQMRGADFERYLARLDEEMSLAVFTPVLLFRTANVGSYNLGQAHLKIFLWMLNSVAGDLQYYLDKYVVDRLRLINFGESSPRARWVYRKLGKDEPQLYAQMVQALIAGDKVMPDLNEMGEALGLTFKEIKQVTQPPGGSTGDQPGSKPPAGDPNPVGKGDTPPTAAVTKARVGPSSLRTTRNHVAAGVGRAYRTAQNGNSVEGFGYRNDFYSSLCASGADTETATAITDDFYSQMKRVLPDLGHLTDRPEVYRDVLGNIADELLTRAASVTA